MTEVITIDGPAGSGKSTVARKVAKRLAFIHLNSGALYRYIGVQAAREGLALDDSAALVALAKRSAFQFVVSAEGETQLLVDGRDIVDLVATSDAGEKASLVAIVPDVRAHLTAVQREVAVSNSLVAEGRDAGTIVFPNARYKFYLDADVEVRAERRFRELEGRGDLSTREKIRSDLLARDERDATRPIAPQVAADDAEVIDTTSLTVDDVVERIADAVENGS